MQGDFSLFSGWFWGLREVSSIEQCASTKWDLYYQGAFSMAKMEQATTSLRGRTHSLFHKTCMSDKKFKITLEKYPSECPHKQFLIQFTTNTAGIWSVMPAQEWRTGRCEWARDPVLSKSTRRICLTLLHLLGYWGCLWWMPGPGSLARFRMLPQNQLVRNIDEASSEAGSGEDKMILWFEMT